MAQDYPGPGWATAVITGFSEPEQNAPLEPTRKPEVQELAQMLV